MTFVSQFLGNLVTPLNQYGTVDSFRKGDSIAGLSCLSLSGTFHLTIVFLCAEGVSVEANCRSLCDRISSEIFSIGANGTFLSFEKIICPSVNVLL